MYAEYYPGRSEHPISNQVVLTQKHEVHTHQILEIEERGKEGWSAKAGQVLAETLQLTSHGTASLLLAPAAPHATSPKEAVENV